MAMTLDQQNNRHIGALGFDHMSYGNGPQFSNPWGTSASNTNLYPSVLGSSNAGFEALAKQQMARTTSIPYASLPGTAPPMNNNTTSTYSTPTYTPSLMGLQTQDMLNDARSTCDQNYSATSSLNAFAPSSVPYTDSYAPLAPPSTSHIDERRLSHASSVSSSSQSHHSFNDALDASRGMVALSQDMSTPRNIYGSTRDRSATTDGYGFPAGHSPHSSISSAGYAPSYYDSASVGSSASDYGSQSDMESVSSRTLPRPSGLAVSSSLPPPQSMMGQFNSKVSSSTQKKHKCKVCDKRFTRPSSLQTHMYSHTGEKPYACEADGCGRHFSVVSNLRRHRKVHSQKGEGALELESSAEESWNC